MRTFSPALISSLREYSAKQFGKDLLAGIIVAIIALPLSIALAIASGVGPAIGLYTAIVAGFTVSLLGGSRVQIAGPTAAFASIVAGIVASKGMDGLAIATIMAGVLLVIMGLCRLGSLIRFIPYTITTGFTSGIAVTILIGQLKDFFGLTFSSSPVETVDKLKEVVRSFTTLNPWAVFIGALSLCILIFLPKVLPRVPASLIAVIVCAVVVAVFHLDVNTIGTLYPDITSAPPAFTWPGADQWKQWLTLLPDALTIAVLAGVESLLSCVVADGMIGTQHNSNTELIAQGGANIASALFGGIPATGAIARTAANIKNGGRTPVSGIVHAIVLLGVLVLFMPYAKLIPMPTIAAILFVVAYNMSEWRAFANIVRKSPRWDTLVLCVTFVLTVLFDLVVAIAVGIILATVLFMKQIADETTVKPSTLNTAEISENTALYEITGPIFFGSSDTLSHLFASETHPIVILQMQGVSLIDATGIHCIENILHTCQQQNRTLILTQLSERPMKTLRKAGILQTLGDDNLCDTTEAACQRAASLQNNAEP